MSSKQHLYTSIKIIIGGGVLSLSCAAASSADEPLTVNWYHGQEFLLPVVKAFTIETGIEVEVTNGDDSYDTDIMFVPDYATVHKAASNGKFSNIQSDERDARVPSQWRDTGGLWYGVLVRLRGIAYNPEKIDGAKIETVYDLMSPDFKGRICLLEGSYKSNRSFLAMLIARDGEDRVRDWARAVRNNMVPLWDNDMDNMSRVAKGECDVTLADNYYYHYMTEGKRTVKYDIPIEYILKMPSYANKVKFQWLDQMSDGNPANITAIAVSPSIENRAAALKFVDFILSDKGQELLSENVFKYPVVPGVEWPYRLKDQGRVKISDFDLNKLDDFYETADEIYKETGWK